MLTLCDMLAGFGEDIGHETHARERAGTEPERFARLLRLQDWILRFASERGLTICSHDRERLLWGFGWSLAGVLPDVFDADAPVVWPRVTDPARLWAAPILATPPQSRTLAEEITTFLLSD